MEWNARLLVEGKDDLHVFCHLRDYHNVPKCFEIKECGGADEVLASIENTAKFYDKLGIVIDADLDIEKRWKQIQKRLLDAGYPQSSIPANPEPDGTIIESQDNKLALVGVWIMPDNKIPGILEDFIQFLIPEEDTLMPRVNDCIDTIPSAEKKFADAHMAKAQIHTWLAWQENPGLPFGTAITAKFLDADRDQAGILINWLKRLFLPILSQETA